MQLSAPPADNTDVTLTIAQGAATITVARPSKINAIRLETWQALRAQVIAADRDSAVGVIVVRGAGKHFSAGNDIAVLGTFPGQPGAALAFGAAWAAAIQAVEEASKPVIMAIEGICYGSALALSLAGDVRIASASARFCIPVAKLGALYLRSDYQRLVATIGMGHSKQLIYSSDVVDAAQALRIGLVEQVHAEECFEAELSRLVETMLTRSPFTLSRSKQLLRGVQPGGVAREDADSLAAFAETTQCADFAEGIAAFLGSRTARFR